MLILTNPDMITKYFMKKYHTYQKSIYSRFFQILKNLMLDQLPKFLNYFFNNISFDMLNYAPLPPSLENDV